MYTVIYLYRVKKIHVQQFIDINEKAGEIYMAHGALEDHTYCADDLNGMHGCTGLLDVINVDDDEELFFGQTVFRNKSHYEEVMNNVNHDEKIKHLFQVMTNYVDLSKVISATFTT
ncbi:DUF1428 family protein [Virgibacillus oceani]|uniref:Uncharacterized protein n=1 Tax=Virgibacillus oceani TaxID=1479511 RepID=A0A917M3D3_9BACI|nr:DUF1428 family protein [Virgibacillus oceani]GGG74730.1 hypothetical protein GCM10011398_19320 [Virgibacillus oceani]